MLLLLVGNLCPKRRVLASTPVVLQKQEADVSNDDKSHNPCTPTQSTHLGLDHGMSTSHALYPTVVNVSSSLLVPVSEVFKDSSLSQVKEYW